MVRPIMCLPARGRYYLYPASASTGKGTPARLVEGPIGPRRPGLRVDQVQRTEVIGLSDVDTTVAQDVVRGDDVEVEVRDLPPEQELLGLQALALGAVQLAHGLGRGAGEVLGAQAVQEGHALRDAATQVFDRRL